MCLSFCLQSLVFLEELSLEFSGFKSFFTPHNRIIRRHEDITDKGITILAEKLSTLINLQSISMTLKKYHKIREFLDENCRNKYITDKGIFDLTTCFQKLKSSLKSVTLNFTG